MAREQRIQMLKDGDRLRDALNALGLSQRQAAKLSGIEQGNISAIISGKRPLANRERLQALARIGIPSDYLLGFTDTLIPVGQTRTLAELERDLADELCRRLMLRFEDSQITADGKQLLDRLTEDEAAALEAWEEWYRHLAHAPEILNIASEHVTYPELGKWLVLQAKHLEGLQPIAPPTRPPIARHLLGGHYTDYPGPPNVGPVRRVTSQWRWEALAEKERTTTSRHKSPKRRKP